MKDHYYQLVFSHINPKDCFSSKQNVYYLVEENIFFQGFSAKKKLMEEGMTVVSVEGFDGPLHANKEDKVRKDAYYYLLRKANEIR